jgi:cell division septation protein DedD
MGRYQEVSLEATALEDDYRGFDGGDDESTRGPLILALAAGVMIVFGAVIWNTYRAGVRAETGGVPSVIADSTPYKRKPDDPGGVAVPDTDKRFYDQMDASNRAPVETAALAKSQSDIVLSGGPPADLRPKDPEVEAAVPTPEPLAASPVQPAAMAPAPVVEPPVVSAPATETSEQFAFSASGDYLVQVAAFRSEEAAEDTWNKAVAAEPGLFRGAVKHVQKADLGAKGVFYRLRIGAFEQRSEASAFCEALKESGSPCIVVNG